MGRLCDLCRKPVEPGEPRFGGKGAGDHTGSPLGFERHYSCHAKQYGRPGSGLREQIANPAVTLRPRRPVKEPRVKRGQLNRSENAARPFELFNFVSEMGKRRAQCDCPFCNARFTVYVWSLSGGGKKCPNCGAMFTSTGQAYPLVGNEDM